MLRNALLLATVTVVLVGGSTVLHTPTLLYKPPFQHAPTFYQTPTVLHTPAYTGYSQKLLPVQLLVRESSDILPCPSEGYYRHPTNCSRFYRCVDHLGNGKFFIRFMFECPTRHVFITGISICVLGSCVDPATTNSSQPTEPSTEAPVQPPTEAPIEPPTEAPIEPPTEAPIEPTTEVQPSSEAPVQSSTEAPIESTTDSTIPPATDLPITSTIPVQTDASLPTESSTDAGVPMVTETDVPESVPSVTTPSTPATGTQACMPRYVQHHTYCNVYVRCDNSSLRYACPAGSAFDQSRQMCRINAADERLCVGKAILNIHSLRTEVVDGHILLPESFVLPPLDLTQPLHTLAVLTKTSPLVAYPSVGHLLPGAGFLHRPQVHLANSFTYPSRKRGTP